MIELIGEFGGLRVLNNFHKQLKYSESAEGLTLVSGTINTLYPDHILIEEVSDLNYQSKGLDRLIYFDNGEVIGVEHKIRETTYNDILFEFISNDNTNTKGWMEKDLICDYFIYGWNPLHETYTFYWPELKKVWNENKKKWLDKHRRIIAKNYGYNTHSVVVPIGEVIDKLWYYHYTYKKRRIEND